MILKSQGLRQTGSSLHVRKCQNSHIQSKATPSAILTRWIGSDKPSQFINSKTKFFRIKISNFLINQNMQSHSTITWLANYTSDVLTGKSPVIVSSSGWKYLDTVRVVVDALLKVTRLKCFVTLVLLHFTGTLFRCRVRQNWGNWNANLVRSVWRELCNTCKKFAPSYSTED